jgi:ABC-type antimicrobial peptide transport system permease subunit
VVQFTVACILILASLHVQRLMNFAKNRDMGYNKEKLIYVALEGDISKNYELIKHDLINSGTAVSVTKTSAPVTQGWSNTWDVNWTGKDTDEKLVFDLYYTDADWTKTVGATIIEGRDIDVFTYPTDSTALLLNEAAVRAMNLKHPIGEIVKTEGKTWHVVGVVKDFIFRSPYEPVTPVLIGGPRGWFQTVHIKLSGYNRMADHLAQAEQIFRQYNPSYPFEYQFVDEDYARKFRNEQKLITAAMSFAGLAILISCMGLFALVAYMAETRRKEIGIRKVLGASVSNIFILLTKEFLILVLISITIAFPVAWLVMETWRVGGYAYYTSIPWWLFVAVGCMTLCIALLTVGFQAIRAATANPVDAIKSE